MPCNEWEFSTARDEYVSESGIIGFRGPGKPENCTWWNHMPAKLVRERVGEETWNGYLKFCVIRNPFDKAVSAFYFFRNQAGTGSTELADLDQERKEFENYLLKGTSIPVDRDNYLIDGEFCLDEVIRYERLAADMERICDRLSIPWNPGFLPNLKSGIRPKGAKVECMYTKKSRDFIEQAFAFELDFFKYSFPS